MRQIALALGLIVFASANAQTAATPADQPYTLTTRSTLVLVPTLVKTKSGELVYTLAASDFLLTDDGMEQKLTLEADNGADPLALVIVAQIGATGVDQLDKYRGLGTSLEAMIGNVPHRVAVVAFDSVPSLEQPFTEDIAKAATTLGKLDQGDGGSAILDALGFSVDLLRRQPIQYRRAILLLSETVDHGSRLAFDDAVRQMSDTNTSIYSIAFSSSKSRVKEEAAKLNNPNTGPAKGCFSTDPNDPNVPPDAAQHRFSQIWDCLSQLAPPLRALTMAQIIGSNGLRRNVPEAVARLTGGESFKMGDTRAIQRSLQTLSNHLPNRYILSFHPQSSHPGFHFLAVHLRDYDHLVVTARNGYWEDLPAARSASPAPAP